MDANWKILLPAPMVVGPLMTACGPIQVPAPMVHAVADDGVRAHRHVGRELRLRRNDGAGIDAAHAGGAFAEVLLVSGATISSAEVTSSSPTYATVVNFQMPRMERSSLAVRMS